jgi:hypothetical protein
VGHTPAPPPLPLHQVGPLGVEGQPPRPVRELWPGAVWALDLDTGVRDVVHLDPPCEGCVRWRVRLLYAWCSGSEGGVSPAGEPGRSEPWVASITTHEAACRLHSGCLELWGTTQSSLTTQLYNTVHEKSRPGTHRCT